ncbi:unnamed protein product [Blepharisma stoltei]|uniref:EF-hand domain-containing protein n=1 Tax=Blepharisma stoltei TaxID=1481888 RepID=A0AAU9K1H1_9CILI|nr:unnamed protein product [Blepharisma stoltei]
MKHCKGGNIWRKIRIRKKNDDYKRYIRLSLLKPFLYNFVYSIQFSQKMSFSQLRYDHKSPLRGEDSQHKNDRIQVFEKRSLKQNFARPLSAKHEDVRSSNSPKPSTKRPTSSKRSVVVRPRFIAKREEDNLITRLRSRNVPVEKEKLYEENMILKVRLNTSNEDIVRLKTKLNHLERELAKKDESIQEIKKQSDYPSPEMKQSFIIVKLKNTNKELKNEILKKEQEISIIRRNVKATKVEELEVEIKAYIDECTRLKHNLEEALAERDQPKLLDENYYQQAFIIENLTKENQELKSVVEKNKEAISKLKGKIEDVEKENPKEHKNSNWKLEIQKLKMILEAEEKEKNDLIREMDKKLEKLNEKTEENRKLKKEKKKLENANQKLESANQKLNEENQNINNDYQKAAHELKTVSSELEKAKRELAELKVEVDKIKAEKSEKAFSKNDVKIPKLFLKIYNYIHKEKISIANFISQLDKDHDGYLSFAEFVKGLKKHKIELKSKHIKSALNKKEGILSVVDIIDKYRKYWRCDSSSNSGSESDSEKEEKVLKKLSSEKTPVLDISETIEAPKPKSPIKETKISAVKIDQISDQLQHISLRMQLNRIPKEEAVLNLFGKITDRNIAFSKSDLLKILNNSSISLSGIPDLDLLCQYLVEPEIFQSFSESEFSTLKSSMRNIEKKLLKSLENWSIFSQEDENKFDAQLASVLSKHSEALLNACKIYDNDSIGTIKLSEFKEAVKKSKITFSDDTWKYIAVLFYSHNNELDNAPYYNFIEAYGNGEEDPQEIERSKLVKFYLEKIARGLVQLKKHPAEVFNPNEIGLISPDNFVDGLEMLGITDIQKDHIIMLLESLQYDQDASTSYIQIKELEEFLFQFGFQIEKFSSESSPDLVRKISLLDSEVNYEYTEDSPDRNLNNSSRELSEASPFDEKPSEIKTNISAKKFENYKKEPQFMSQSPSGIKINQGPIDEENYNDSDVSDVDSDIVNNLEINQKSGSFPHKFEEEKIKSKKNSEIKPFDDGYFVASKPNSEMINNKVIATENTNSIENLLGSNTILSNLDTNAIKDIIDSEFTKGEAKEKPLETSSLSSSMYNEDYGLDNPFQLAKDITSGSSIGGEPHNFASILPKEKSIIRTEESDREIKVVQDFVVLEENQYKPSFSLGKEEKLEKKSEDSELGHQISPGQAMRGSATIFSEYESEYESQNGFKTPLKSVEGLPISDPQTLVNKQSLTYSSSSDGESLEIRQESFIEDPPKQSESPANKENNSLVSIENANPGYQEEIIEDPVIDNKDTLKFVEEQKLVRNKSHNFEPDIEPIRSEKSSSSIEDLTKNEVKDIAALAEKSIENSQNDSDYSSESDFEIETYQEL